MLIQCESITIKTHKLGLLTFSVLDLAEIRKSSNLSGKITSDRAFFLEILQRLAREPKKSLSELESLSDRVLIRIGKELLINSNLVNRYKSLKISKGNFFRKFGILFSALVKDVKETQHRLNAALSSPVQKIMDEERKRHELLRNSFTYPFNSIVENSAMQLHKEALAAKEWFNSSRSAFESIDNHWYKKYLDDMQGQIAASELFMGKYADIVQSMEKFAAPSWPVESSKLFSATDSINSYIASLPDFVAQARAHTDMLTKVSADIAATDKLIGNFSAFMKAGVTIADDFRNIYDKMAIDEIMGYQKAWDSFSFPAFIEAPLNIFGDYILEATAGGYLIQEEIDRAISVEKFLRDVKGRPLIISKKTKVLCAVISLEFLKTMKDLGDRLADGTLTKEMVAIVILILSTQLLILYYQFLDENPRENNENSE